MLSLSKELYDFLKHPEVTHKLPIYNKKKRREIKPRINQSNSTYTYAYNSWFILGLISVQIFIKSSFSTVEINIPDKPSYSVILPRWSDS